MSDQCLKAHTLHKFTCADQMQYHLTSGFSLTSEHGRGQAGIQYPDTLFNGNNHRKLLIRIDALNHFKSTVFQHIHFLSGGTFSV